MDKLDEKNLGRYWKDLFGKMCHQSSLDEWEGIPFKDVLAAAQDNDKSAKEYIFWQMRNIIETVYAKYRRGIKSWTDRLGLYDDANEPVDNWVSASWLLVFEGYPLSENNTLGPLINYAKPERGIEYLTWLFYKKAPNLLFAENSLEATNGLSKNIVSNKIDTVSGNEKVYGDEMHGIRREIQDTFESDMDLPEEELELQDNLKSFRAFTKDPELNEKKNGFSPMVAFRTVLMNMADPNNFEKNVAMLAKKYNVARNTFAAYAQKAATTLRDEYNVSLEDVQNLIKRYGAGALARIIKESTFIPKQLTRINENYDFKLLESLFTGKAILNESDESIYDAHVQYEKDVEQKKEEDDNQENFKFDEGSVKLTTVKESDESISKAHEEFKKDQEAKKEEDDNQENLTFDEGSVKLTTVKEGARKYYIRMEYAEGDDAWDDIYGPFTAERAEQEYNGMRKEFAYAISQGCAEVYYCDANGNYAKPPLKESRGTYTGNIAECPCCGHTIRQDQYEDYTCEECGEIWEDDDLDWHPDGDEYEDGHDNREGFDLLELMSESTNLKEHENPYKAKAHALCEELTKDVDWENEDDDLSHAANNILGFIYAMIGESMEYFPTDAYDRELWDLFEDKYSNYEK